MNVLMFIPAKTECQFIVFGKEKRIETLQRMKTVHPASSKENHQKREKEKEKKKIRYCYDHQQKYSLSRGEGTKNEEIQKQTNL